MQRILMVALIVIGAAFSGGCYVTQDANGQWMACEQYQTPNGAATACTPIEKPF